MRIGEIQAATNGDVSEWAWMSGKLNTADWLTRGRTPCDLDQNSEWWNGPNVFYQPETEWDLKFSVTKEEALPGEKKLSSGVTQLGYLHSSNILVSAQSYGCTGSLLS